EGKRDVRQDQTFAPIYLRGRTQTSKAVEVAS
ncbi:segregation/condensation protein A, partial [Mesorhizobium sp. M7A.F.Ca.US.014.04.1.1]